MREGFALQKLLFASHFFQPKNWQISDIYVRNFNETFTSDVVSFKQPGPEVNGWFKQVCSSGVARSLLRCFYIYVANTIQLLYHINKKRHYNQKYSGKAILATSITTSN